MADFILDDIKKIKRLDSHNMLGSLQSLSAQVKQIFQESKGLKLPSNYGKVSRIVVAGMGGSAIGAHVFKALFYDKLKAPVEIVNGYHLPAYVNGKTLVVASSYSGDTEETVEALYGAKKRKAKILVIASGGKLADFAEKNNLPALIFSIKNNPCGSPRLGLGYSIAGQWILFAKAGLLGFSARRISIFQRSLSFYGTKFGIFTPFKNNTAKQLAAEINKGKTVWYVGSEHLLGNAHVGANQMNESGKRFAGWFAIPELNHHLLEGMTNPQSNKDNILFVFLGSSLYNKRVQKRYGITKKVLDKNRVQHFDYFCREKDKLNQAAEALVLTSYTSFYSAILSGIDPTPIPFVDYFKKQMSK